ncbi:MAG: transcription initiation factor IIB family protein [Nitrososphaeraceae archaeon]
MLNFITQSRIVCSTCSSDRVIHDPESGEVICSSCGMVISDRIQNITMPERRDFKNSETESRRRTGIPVSLARYDMGLATVIANTNRDASGRPLGAEMRARMQRLRTWDLRTSYTYLDKNLTQAFDELDILKDKLALSDAVVEKAAYIYRKVEDRGLVRGRTISGIMAAAIYAACREVGTLWTLRDIAATSDVKRKDIARNYRMLLLEFDFKVPNADPMYMMVSGREIAAGKDPMGIAASILFISCIKTGEYRTQSQIANASGVTEVTVRNRYKELKSKLLS